VKKHSLPHWILLADIIWTLLAICAAYVLRYGFVLRPEGVNMVVVFAPVVLASALLWAGLSSWMKLDGFRLGWYLPAVVAQLLLATLMVLGTVLAVAYMSRFYISRLALAYFGILLLLGFVAIRRGVNAIVRSNYLKRPKRRVLIVGNGPVAREMASKFELHPEMLCEVVGFLSSADISLDTQIRGVAGAPSVVQTLGVVDLLRRQSVDEVVITVSKPGVPEIMNLAARCRQAGVVVSIVPHPYELYISKPQLLDIGGLPVLRLDEGHASFATSAWKRSFDILLSCLLLPLSLPFVIVGALALFTKSGGSFCGEERCGRFGKPFRMYRLNSDRNSPTVPTLELILQQLSITELPQLWNVLWGDMSLVGPRPEAPERVMHYSDWHRQRLNVKPGITGLAQVRGLRQQHSSEEKTRFDLQYLLHSSPFLDLSLLLQTMWTVVGRLLQVPSLLAVRDASEPASRKFSEQTFSRAHSTQSSAD
jgi:lipopolysaccharide/colanic/teichoic acid biosynthesis glycosyltransferase